jgi:hypothetical protein
MALLCCLPSWASTGSEDGTGVTTTASLLNSAATTSLEPEFYYDPDDQPFSEQDAFEQQRELLMAQADQGGGDGEPLSPECQAFAADPDANIGTIIKAGCKPTLVQMSKLMDNPLGSVVMLFNQVDFYVKKDDRTGREDTMYNYMGIAQFPKKLNDNWSLVNRVIWNVPSMPLSQSKIDDAIRNGPGNEFLPDPGGALPIDVFSGRTTGFGDLYYVGLFTPTATKMDNGALFAWGVGFDIGAPTASDDILGTDKWTAGPSALAIYMGPKWKVGGLVTHYKDFGGESSAPDVNLTNLQYIVYRSLSPTTAIGAAPNIICNWESEGDECTVPIGIGFSTTIQMGKVPVRFGAELHYSIIQPDDLLSTKWDFRFYVIPSAPSALFDWMQ